MADREKDSELDDMLDSLLAGYSAVEPRPGLQARILANLREAEGREVSPGWWNVKWLWAGAVVAAIIIAAILIVGRRNLAPPDKTVVQIGQPVPKQPEVQRTSPATATAVPRHRKTFVESGRQNVTLALKQRPPVFPTPTPLSEQERLLLRYYSGTPREEVIAQSHPDEPPAQSTGETQDQTGVIPDLTHIPQHSSNTR
jgi:hypothetical protein